MDIGPLKAEPAIADTRRLMKEGFIVVIVEGAGLESAWNFLFDTVRESTFFRQSIAEIAGLYPAGRVADRVIAHIALNYKTVCYTFTSAAEALKFTSWITATSSAQ